MKVTKLITTNVKKVKAVEVVFTDNTVIISGRNAQGKSSVLDSLLYALAGKKYIPEKPIRDGEDKAKIVVEMDNGLVITRSFTPGNTYLKVETADGAIFTKGQEKLTNMIGDLAFDPLEFSQKDAKVQKEIILKLVGLDLEEQEEKRKEIFEERALVNKMGKQYVGELAGLTEPKEGEKTELVDIVKLSQKANELQSLLADILNTARRARSCQLEVQRLDELLKEAKSDFKLENEKFKSLKDQEEVEAELSGIQEDISGAEAVNNRVREIEKYTEIKDKINSHKDESNKMTAKMKKIDDKKLKQIQNADMPIEGLGFDENGILYNDIPFGQLSSAEQLKVSMSVAMALNPELRLIRIMDGSLLDKENMAIIQEMVKDQDYQAIIEVVKDEKGTGFYIEDGEIV